MRLPFRFLWIIFATGSLFFTACEKEEGENETSISTYASDESHHNGDNCMNCHRSGGSG